MTPEENDLLCRVEGAAPMGQIMRRHWIAACLSEEVAEPDGTPVRVGDVATLLGDVGGDRITLAQLREWSGDIEHAVLTSLGARPPRIYT